MEKVTNFVHSPRYGGESAMMEAVGHDTKVNFRVNVMFCLCLWCPNGVLLTKKRIRYIKAAVFQMPYIQVPALQGDTSEWYKSTVDFDFGCFA